MKNLIVGLFFCVFPLICQAQEIIIHRPVRTYRYNYPIRRSRPLVEYYPGLDPNFRVYRLREYQPVRPIYQYMPYWGFYYYGY